MDEQTDDTAREPGVGRAEESSSGSEDPPAPMPTTAAEVLRGLSFAGYAAAAVIAALMAAVWAQSDSYGEPDFPGRYLFALLPVLAAAWAMGSRAAELDRKAARRD